jgi:hypothetical protein
MDRDDRDDVIVEERIAGKSSRALAKQHRCSTVEVEAAVDRRLDYALDNNMRMRAIKLDVARIEALMAPFFERATKDRDVAAGTLCCKLLERRALLLGLDQPTQSRIDVYQVAQESGPHEFDRVFQAVLKVARGGNGGAPGDVGGLSDSDDKTPSN